MTTIVGIDPSAKKIAVVATVPMLGTTTAQAFNLYAKGQTVQSVESLGRAADAVDTFLEWLRMADPRGPHYAWVENPLVGRAKSVGSTIKQTYVNGIIRGLLVRGSVQVYGVDQATWKAYVCGAGNAGKPEVALAVGRHWPKIKGLIGDDGDLTDAAAICLYGQEAIRKGAAIAASSTP